MIIKIDTRETTLLQILLTQITTIPVFKNIKIKTETLPIGDIIICDEKEEKVIIERKSISDLLASIKDGRYEEQSYRLNGINHHNHNIVYLIEGDINRQNRFKSDNQLDKLTAYSAMFSLNYYKGFSVFRSFSMEETANIVCNMAYKLEKTGNTKKPYYSYNYNNNNNIQTITELQTNGEKQIEQTENTCENNNNNIVEPESEPTDKDYVGVIKKVKKENITPDNIGEIMLCQIPGISSVTALAIMEKYKSIPNLIKELENNTDCLKDTSYTNSKGQIRKINKTSIMNIVKYLLKK